MSRMIRAQLQYPSVAFSANTGRMKPDEIRARLKRSGRSQAALARHLGIQKDSMSRLIKGRRTISVEEAEAIREFFAGDEARAPSFQQVPMFGFAAAGGDDRISLAEDRVLEHIEVPAGLVRGEMIAVRIPGDSMEPRLYAGEVVIIARGVPPQRNGDCLVELSDGSAMVKQYRGQKDGVVFLHQYNPEKEVRLQGAQIRKIHAVAYRR